jgi:hypothetical protein
LSALRQRARPPRLRGPRGDRTQAFVFSRLSEKAEIPLVPAIEARRREPHLHFHLFLQDGFCLIGNANPSRQDHSATGLLKPESRSSNFAVYTVMGLVSMRTGLGERQHARPRLPSIG